MNKDTVYRQAAIDAVENAFDRETILNRFVRKIAISAIRLLPSAEPEIIRCKDCKYIAEHHYEENGEPPCIKYTCAYKAGLAKGYQVHEWDFCSRAERRER